MVDLLDTMIRSESSLGFYDQGKLSWPGYASEELYGKNILFYLTKLGECQSKCEMLIASVVSSSDSDMERWAASVDILESEVDGIPKGAVESWARNSEEPPVPSLRNQVQKLRT